MSEELISSETNVSNDPNIDINGKIFILHNQL